MLFSPSLENFLLNNAKFTKLEGLRFGGMIQEITFPLREFILIVVFKITWFRLRNKFQFRNKYFTNSIFQAFFLSVPESLLFPR